MTLKDTAVISGGYYETAITPAPVSTGSTKVDTETAATGNGTYTTPTATRSTTGIVIGTYQWAATYGGDTNNGTAHDQGGTAEQTVVSPASPSIVTTPNPSAVALSSSSVTINGTKYLDPTGNGFTSDDTPQSGVTIDLNGSSAAV